MTIKDLTEQVKNLQPGEHTMIGSDTIYASGPAPTGWTTPEYILENITDAAFAYGYYEELETGSIIFYRRKEPFTPESGRRTYVSPDHRDVFRLLPDGTYQAKEKS